MHALLQSLQRHLWGDPTVNHVLGFVKPYDWTQFTLESFLSWLSLKCNRQIVVMPWKFPKGITGAWVTSDDEEVFLFEESLSSTLQTHVVLHEVGHWLMGHQTLNLDQFLRDGYTREDVVGTIHLQVLNRAPMPNRYDEKREWQAEAFATFVTTKIIEANPTILSEDLKAFKIEAS